MLEARKKKSSRIEMVRRIGNSLILYSKRGMHRLQMLSERTVRITYTERNHFSERKKEGVLAEGDYAGWDYQVGKKEIVVVLPELCIRINSAEGAFSYYSGEGSDCRLLLKEREHESRILERFQSYRLETAGKIEEVETPDGVKKVVRDAVRTPDGELYHTRLHLNWQEGEALYGLGQQEEGLLNLRGQTVYVHQANRKIAVPMLVSSLGYGILVDTYSPMIFCDTVYGSYLYTEADEEMDFYFMNGSGMDGVVREYRHLTGKAAMLPKWAFGYLQSQERYETQEEVCRVAAEFRARKIGLDGIILDWMSWEDGMWGQKSFDTVRFPEPDAMTGNLHEMNVHFMISIWPNMDPKCENAREMREAGALLPACDVYDALTEEGRQLYWEQVNRGLYCHGIDAWWCDSSEPFTPEWNHRERVEPGKMYEEYIAAAGDHLPARAMNAFPLYHARALYEGQRGQDARRMAACAEKDCPAAERSASEVREKDRFAVEQCASGVREKRVFNLTRSAYTGQQRYGTVLWSGDTEAKWETLRKQIAAGLSFCASGLPYWTADIGAFFVKQGDFWYWDGDYDNTTEDPGYLELYTRWYQWGAFLPIFRGHGTDCRREPWAFQGGDGRFYQAILRANRLRYELMPYIYSTAGRVWLEDGSMIRMLAFRYPREPEALGCKDQYLFGDSLMVCPVTEPMYYGRGGQHLGLPAVRRVYLPEADDWFDYWTGTVYQGGQWIEADAPIGRIPLFVRAGSILPVQEAAESTASPRQITFRVYAGKDATLRLYEDDGDGYGYEAGAYTIRTFTWSEKEQTLREEMGAEVPCEVCRGSTPISKEEEHAEKNCSQCRESHTVSQCGR